MKTEYQLISKETHNEVKTALVLFREIIYKRHQSKKKWAAERGDHMMADIDDTFLGNDPSFQRVTKALELLQETEQEVRNLSPVQQEGLVIDHITHKIERLSELVYALKQQVTSLAVQHQDTELWNKLGGIEDNLNASISYLNRCF